MDLDGAAKQSVSGSLTHQVTGQKFALLCSLYQLHRKTRILPRARCERAQSLRFFEIPCCRSRVFFHARVLLDAFPQSSVRQKFGSTVTWRSANGAILIYSDERRCKAARLLDHGPTRMIVFPLRRSVGFKAASAPARVAMLPMFARRRPSADRTGTRESAAACKPLSYPHSLRAGNLQALRRTLWRREDAHRAESPMLIGLDIGAASAYFRPNRDC